MELSKDEEKSWVAAVIRGQVAKLYKQRAEKLAMLKENVAQNLHQVSNLMVSAELVGIDAQIDVLKTATGWDGEPIAADGHTCFSAMTPGQVAGTGMYADKSELGTARLVLAARESPQFCGAEFELPWAWLSSQEEGGAVHVARLVARTSFQIDETPGGSSGPAQLAYLWKAGALLPALVREVVALRAAWEEAKNYLSDVPGYLDEARSEAEVLIEGTKKGEER